MATSMTSWRLAPIPLQNFLLSLRAVLTSTIQVANIQRTEIQETMNDILALMNSLTSFFHLPHDYETLTERLLRRTIYLYGLFKKFGVPYYEMLPILEKFDRPVRVLILHEYLEKYFRVISEIGKGDYGTVYKVRDKVHGREYAMKMVESKFTDMDNIIKAKKEVNNMAKLAEHKHIVKCHFAWIQPGCYFPEDSGDTTNWSQTDSSRHFDPQGNFEDRMVSILYIQMELCAKSLASWLATRNQRLAECTKPDDSIVQESLQIFTQIAEAVSHMHSILYYHGDIKTANILMDKNDVPKIADFGLTSLHKEWKCGRFERDIEDIGQVLVELLCPFHSTEKCEKEMIEIDRCADIVKIDYEKLVKIDSNEERLNVRPEDLCSALKACPDNMVRKVSFI